MRLACPECAAEYQLPTGLLQAGPRSMRCARCTHVWTAEVAEEAPAPAAAPPDDTAAILARLAPSPVPPVPRQTALMVAWATTALCITSVTLGAVMQRQALVEAWPPSARAFRAIGLY